MTTAQTLSIVVLGVLAPIWAHAQAVRPERSVVRALPIVPRRSETVHALPRGCDTAWSIPRDLRTAAGNLAYVEVNSVLQTRRGTMLFGVPTLFWSSETNFVDSTAIPHPSPAGVRLLSETTATALPSLPSATTPFSPVVVADGSDLTVLWATSRDTTRYAATNQHEVWTSTLHRGRWSAPVRVWRSSIVLWHSWTVSILSRTRGPIVAFPVADSARGLSGGIAVVARDERWREHWISTGSIRPIAVAAMEAAPGELLLATVGSLDRDGLVARNAVYVVRVKLTDRLGVPSFSLLRQFDGETAADPQFYRASDGIHLVWRKKSRVESAPDSVFDAASVDGRSWSSPSALSLDGKFRDLRIAQTSDRTATGVAVELRTGRIILLDGVRGKWGVRSGPGDEAKTAPSLDVVAGRLLMTYGVTRKSGGLPTPYDAPVLRMSRRALRCENSSRGSSSR